MNLTRWIGAVTLVAVIALVFGLVFSGVSGAADADASIDVPQDAFQVDIDEDSIEMEPTVGADGDADWRVVYRLELDSDEEREAFAELEDDIEEDPSAYLDPFEDRIRDTAGNAETATEREMTVRNFAVTTERTAQPDAEFGAVVFTFEWDGFAAVDTDGTVRAGDALDSLFLDEGTSLTVRWDESLTLDSHSPQADSVADQRLTWRGPQDFDTGEPRVVLTSGGAWGVDGLPLVPALLVGLLVIVAGAGAVAYLRRESESTAEADGSETAVEESAGQEPPSELLSNEERVLTLVEDNGGRIKQKKVAETLDWSAAMTSQVVGNLREEGKIETFRIGRENVLTLPDVDIVPDQDDDETSDGDDRAG